MTKSRSKIVSLQIYFVAIAGAFILSGCGSSSSFSWYVPSGGGGGGPVWSLSKTTTYSNGLAVDSSGSIYVAGQTTGNLACNGASCASSSQGDADYFVTKYSSGGSWVWTQQLGETGTITSVNSMVIDASSNIYVAGTTSGDLASCNGKSSQCSGSSPGGYFISKYTSGGTWVWTRQLGEASVGGGVNAMAIDASSNIYVFGSTGGNLVSCNGVSSSCSGTSQGTNDYFISKYSSNGNWIWTKQMGETGQSADGYGGAVDSASNVYIIGATTGNLASCNGVSSSCSGSAQGTEDYYVSKYASDGTWVWTKQLGETGQSTEALSVAVDASSNVYVTGRSMGNLASCNGVSSSCSGSAQGRWDYFISKYTSSGTWVWTQQMGETGQDATPDGIAVDSSSNIYVTGYTSGNLVSCNGVSASCSGSSQGVYDSFISKYAANGAWISTSQLGETGQMALGSRIFIDSSSNLYLTGDTTGNLMSCNGLSSSCSGSSRGNQDFYFSKYASGGAWLSTTQL